MFWLNWKKHFRLYCVWCTLDTHSVHVLVLLVLIVMVLVLSFFFYTRTLMFSFKNIHTGVKTDSSHTSEQKGISNSLSKQSLIPTYIVGEKGMTCSSWFAIQVTRLLVCASDWNQLSHFQYHIYLRRLRMKNEDTSRNEWLFTSIIINMRFHHSQRNSCAVF